MNALGAHPRTDAKRESMKSKRARLVWLKDQQGKTEQVGDFRFPEVACGERWLGISRSEVKGWGIQAGGRLLRGMHCENTTLSDTWVLGRSGW